MSRRSIKLVTRSPSRRSPSYITSTIPAAPIKAGKNSIFRKSRVIRTKRNTAPAFRKISGRPFRFCRRRSSANAEANQEGSNGGIWKAGNQEKESAFIRYGLFPLFGSPAEEPGGNNSHNEAREQSYLRGSNQPQRQTPWFFYL